MVILLGKVNNEYNGDRAAWARHFLERGFRMVGRVVLIGPGWLCMYLSEMYSCSWDEFSFVVLVHSILNSSQLERIIVSGKFDKNLRKHIGTLEKTRA